MSTKRDATRRTFFGKAGAALFAPLAASQALAGESRSDDLAKKVARLEDLNAIRAELQRYAQRVSSGADTAPDLSVRALSLEHEDIVEVAADGTATAQVACTVEIAKPIDGADTIVEMARLQGDGVVKGRERRVLLSSLVKRNGTWAIDRVEFRS